MRLCRCCRKSSARAAGEMVKKNVRVREEKKRRGGKKEGRKKKGMIYKRYP
jgi:hypothetical protein